jgi:hypothetical protein
VINEYLRGLCLAAFAGLSLSSASAAATLTESDYPGGAFSGAWSNPTEVGAGFTGVAGTGNQNQPDIFRFTALPAGAQTITLAFTAPAGIDQSYSAGGSVRYAFTPFRHEWDGTQADWVQVGAYKPGQLVTLTLADSFAGPLYLGLFFTHGKDLAYNISVPSNAAGSLAPVPVPAGILLLGSALGAIGLAGLRGRRRTVHALSTDRAVQ